MLFPRDYCSWNLTALRENKEDFALVVKTFGTNYNKQISVFNVFFYFIKSQSHHNSHTVLISFFRKKCDIFLWVGGGRMHSFRGKNVKENQ